MIRNSARSYGWIAITLHWIMAAGIFFLFGLGLYMVELTYYDTWYKGSLDLHKGLGILLLILWLARFVWRLINPEPEITGTVLEKKAAHFAHVVLYWVMLALMITGYLISTADGRGIDVFGLFEIPALSVSFDNQEDIAGEIHWWLAWGLILMAAGHGVAALKHQFINKDGTLNKMLRP